MRKSLTVEEIYRLAAELRAKRKSSLRGGVHRRKIPGEVKCARRYVATVYRVAFRDRKGSE